jgi:hypothetical protein
MSGYLKAASITSMWFRSVEIYISVLFSILAREIPYECVAYLTVDQYQRIATGYDDQTSLFWNAAGIARESVNRPSDKALFQIPQIRLNCY